MDGEAGWWTTSGKIVLPPPPLARVMGVGRQQQQQQEQHPSKVKYNLVLFVSLSHSLTIPYAMFPECCVFSGLLIWNLSGYLKEQ